MSTKIYSGIIIDIDDIWSVESKIRESLSKTFDEKNKEITNEYIMRAYEDCLYNSIINNHTTMYSSYEMTARAIIQLQEDRKNTNFREPLEAKVIIYPPLDENNKSLGIVIAEDDTFRKNLLNLPFIQDYSYWNNTDKPHHISEKKWEERRKKWNKVFENSDSSFLLNSGICIDLGRTIETFEMSAEYSAYLYDGTYSFDTLKTINLNVIYKIILFNASNFPELTKNVFKTLLTIKGYVNDKINDIQDAHELPIFELPVLREEELNKGVSPSLPRIDHELVEEWIEEIMSKLMYRSSE